MNTLIPDSSGIWESVEDGTQIEVYPLEPVNNILCVWAGDVGINLNTSDVWSTDEWLGHIPVDYFVSETRKLWRKISPE